MKGGRWVYAAGTKAMGLPYLETLSCDFEVVYQAIAMNVG